jgi:hypothetical protein
MFLQDLACHNQFVKSFLETRKRPWSPINVGSIPVPPKPPAQSVLMAYQDYLQFDRDFRGFCSILNTCFGIDANNNTRLTVQKSSESQAPPDIPQSQVPDY